ncbi:sterol desaturase family protein [Desertivirga xinjiangensis]|uniref:sterol desaturase family protein n=1 Tax=Desertivirga xinjiangensis TaxID=539206 RepID=UPI00210E57C8|nr:sterol desaturase family protein [Pedobacter xinjiangensis]
METVAIKNKGQARLFKNSVLESLSKTRPWMIYSIYIPLSAFMVYYSYSQLGFSISAIFILFVSGLISWSLFEYIAHRYLFHYHASSDLGQRIVYIFHGNHHEYPRDKMRLFMPPIPSIIFAGMLLSIIWVLFYLFNGTGKDALVFFPGFIIGYLAYVSMHYAIHAFTPPKYLKALWRNHHLHHYKYPEKGFGVSSTLWDVIFGTLPERRASPETNGTNRET